MNKKSLFIELTISDNCNCNCKYCFEGKHPIVLPNIKVLQRQLELIALLCKEFDFEKYEWLTFSFWGGEPFMDVAFIDLIIALTKLYSFVRYHCYSNGTLVDKYKLFLSKDYISEISNRLHILLSYDGEPHHTLKRGNNSKNIFEVADMLLKKNIKFSFKATLSFDMLKYLPLIWDSYEELYLKYGDLVKYYPTLDTDTVDSTLLEIWKENLKLIAHKEFNFFKKHHRVLFGWFNTASRHTNCALGNSIFMHSNGNIYICHGCAYKDNNSNFLIGNVYNINSLFEVISNKLDIKEVPEQCNKCSATHCQVCHIVNILLNLDPYENWIKCKVNNKERCNFFKEFGYISRLLHFSLLRERLIYGCNYR